MPNSKNNVYLRELNVDPKMQASFFQEQEWKHG